MIKLFSGAAIAALMLMAAVPAQAQGPVCLTSRSIQDTTATNGGHALLFKLRDGSVWRNDLKGGCPDIKWDGYAWATANPGASICDNEQVLHLFKTGETCQIGKFTQITPPRMERHAEK